MKTTDKCPKCSSADIFHDALLLAHSDGSYDEVNVAQERNPKAWFDKGRRQTAVSAWVCVGCGYTELYADDPKSIRLDIKSSSEVAEEQWRSPFDPK